ncbi:homologous-pairing protein 2 homolog isoform X2 [Rhodnius prolixus]|uniref:Homologous-pairing protein 2 homolog n=2 Tax=Rhodnius prolixus TaxID=13249 RepID=T1HMW1_RHOPR
MASQAVLKYLQDTNRPYSANDIVQNMHKEYSKSQIQKSLDELVADGSIIEKVYGKQKVYCIKQKETAEDNNDEELTELNAKIASTTNLLTNLKNELTTTEASLKILLSEPTTEDALNEVNLLKNANTRMSEKIELLKKSTNLIPEKEKIAISKAKTANLNEFKKRKRLCMNVINEILENYPKSKKVLLEEIGIDQDGDQILEQILN